MKVAFVTDHLLRGGKERRLISIVNGLIKRGKIEPLLILWDGIDRENSIGYSSVFEHKIPIYYLGQNKRVRNAFEVIRILRNEDVRVISFWAPPVYSFLMIPAQLILRLRVYNSSITGAKDGYSLKARLVSHSLFYISRKVNSNCQRAMDVFKIPKRKQSVIYNGFQFERLANLLPSMKIRKRYDVSTRYIVSMAGRLNISKDWNTHIMAAERILDRGYDVTFICMGGGDVNGYQQKVRPECRDRIKFVGSVLDVESVFAASDIVTLSTFGEGISNSILEGMAVAKPIVVTEGGGTPEIVEHGKSGFITKMGDAEDYASRIVSLLDNEFMRVSFGERGLQIVHEKFAYDKMVEQFEAMLTEK